MTRALFFDIGNVLIRFDPRIALRGLAASTHRPEEEMVELLKGWRLVPEYECGRVSTIEFFDEICALLSLHPISMDDFREIWSGVFMQEMLVSPEILRTLRKSYRLGLISNTNELHFGVISEKFPVLSEFHDATLSFQVGAMKPAPEMFSQAVRRAGCAPGESLFIDDLEENVQAARAFGIPSIRFQTQEQLLAELLERGIRVNH